MTCVSKEYKINTKMVQEQWIQLKNNVFIGLQLENWYLVGRIKFWWGEPTGGGFLQVGEMSKFSPGGGRLPSRENPVERDH